MAKNSDHLAGFEVEDTGGLFGSLLAEEDDTNRRGTLWRVASWGVGAVTAVVIAAMANQSSLGWRREQAATSDLVQQANRLQATARESQNEARRLASAIDTLNSDRDRLYTRVTVLEQGLDSITGAIARQNVAAAVPAPLQPVAQPQPAAQPSAPAIAPAATKPAPPSEKTTASSAEPAPASNPAIKDLPTKPTAMPVTPLVESKSVTAPAATKQPVQSERATAAASAEPTPASSPTVKEVATKLAAAKPAPPLVESKSMMAPPDPAAGKLIEPAKVANSIAAEPIPPVVAATQPGESAEQETAEAPLPRIQRTEFGVDVGGANSIAGLRALWRGLLKSRANAPLAALQPIIVIREGAGGRGMQLRLVAGPLSDAAAAAKLCAVMSENKRDCETAVYDGQRLSFKAEDAPAEAKPVAPAATRKRNAQQPQKRAAVEEPAKKPEAAPSSSWTLFGKKN